MKMFALSKGAPGVIAMRDDNCGKVGFQYGPWIIRKNTTVDLESIIDDPISRHNGALPSDEAVLFKVLKPELDTIIQRGNYYFITSYDNLELVQ